MNNDQYILETFYRKRGSVSLKFLLFLLVPFLILSAYLYLRIPNQPKPTAIVEAETKNEPTPNPTTQVAGDSEINNNNGVVLNNDSYWKISKRYCGHGRAYLLIKELNAGKALFAGDSVLISCF
jgi:uncharacterized protein (UPF0333 family)